ncbi:MAG: amino acid--tRNA ligase-related protein [Methanosarcinales archaeon]
MKTTIKRITYAPALEILKKNNLKIKWGDDIPPEGERILCKKFNPVIITKWPIDLRAFYAMPENEKVCRAYDLLYNGIEISSGAQRIHLYEELIDAMKRKGLKPKNFKFYLDAFKYGMPPHGGFSIGLERFTMALLKLSNIREATLFPRTKERVTP